MIISLGAVLVAVSLLIVIGFVVAKPFVDARARVRAVIEEIMAVEEPSPQQKRADLVKALRDLEFDYATGKVSQEDYQAIRGQILVEIAALDEALASVTEAEQEQASSDLDALVEQAVRQRREQTSAQCKRCGHALRPRDRFCPMCGEPVARAHTCSKCGVEIPAVARFCPTCGTPVAEAYEVMA